MLKHVVLLLFLCGIKGGSSSSSNLQEQISEAKEISKNGIKKNEVGANGIDNKSTEVLKNFRNPVLEYLLQKNPDRTNNSPQNGIIREIRHSQTLVVPNFHGGILPLAPSLLNQISGSETAKEPVKEVTRNPEKTPLDNFWNFLKNKSEIGSDKSHESVVTSQVVQLNNGPKGNKDLTRVQVYPAVAVLVHTFDKDGTLKNSVTHFQPDFNSVQAGANGKEANYVGTDSKFKNIQNSRYTVNNYFGDGQKTFPEQFQRQNNYPQQGRQGAFPWPFANYFPIVINDPFLSTYNAFTSSMYNAVSTMIEYGPEADICRKEKLPQSRINVENKESGFQYRSEKVESDTERIVKGVDEQKVLNPYQKKEEDEVVDPNFFDEVTMRTASFQRPIRRPIKIESERSRRQSKVAKELRRKRRDTTSIFLKRRQGGRVNITLEEPVDINSKQRNPERSDLILRKGGIAIAGPGGAATAYTGGTAIVGPYGTVYKSPEGIAILGPFSKIINITDDTSFEEILRMHREMQSESQKPNSKNQEPAGRGFKNYKNFFSYMTDLPIKIEPKARSFIRNRPNILQLKEDDITKTIEEIRKEEFRRVIQDTPYDQRMVKKNETTLIFRPKSKAEAGRNGVALSAPTSHAILFPGQKANIYFEPESVASAGPSGFAHAHSDLFVSYIPNNTTVEAPVTSTERQGRSLKLILRPIRRIN